MVAPYNPPVKGEDFVCYICVEDMQNPGRHKVNPTIAAGDFKISQDDGAEANPGTLPSVSPAGSAWIKIALTAAEMNADNVKIRWSDQTSPAEWADDALDIPTTA